MKAVGITRIPDVTQALLHFATAVLIAVAVALVLRHAVVGTGPISLGVQFAGLLLVFWARITFGIRSYHCAANPTRGPLVTTGPYRYMRNPIYAAVLLVVLPGLFVHFSWTNAVLALVIVASLVVKIVCEESLLRAAYPEYREYAAKTARLIPFLL